MNEITTDRLTLRPFEMSDTEAFFELFQDEETMRFMHIRPHQSPKQTRKLFKQDIQYGAEYWTIRQKDSDQPIGNIHFIGGTRVPGMGYMLNRAYWNQGIATEALGAMLSYAFNEKKLDRLELWINEYNPASQRVAEKLGFRVTGRIHQRYDWEENHHIMLAYGLHSDEWPHSENPLPRKLPAFFGAQPVLLVTDVAKTTTYYEEKLGFEVDFIFGEPPSHAGLARGDWSPDDAYLQFTQAASDEKINPQGWIYLMVEAQIDRLYEEYLAKGVEILRPLETYPWGMREFSIRDLNGYELRFGTRDAGITV